MVQTAPIHTPTHSLSRSLVLSLTDSYALADKLKHGHGNAHEPSLGKGAYHISRGPGRPLITPISTLFDRVKTPTVLGAGLGPGPDLYQGVDPDSDDQGSDNSEAVPHQSFMPNPTSGAGLGAGMLHASHVVDAWVASYSVENSNFKSVMLFAEVQHSRSQ